MATRGRFRAINACEYRTRVRAGISLPVYKVRCSRKRQLFRPNIVSVPAFLSSLFVDCVYSFFFFVRFREIEIIFVIDNFELYGSIFFCWICISFYRRKYHEIIDFYFSMDFIDNESGSIQCLHYRDWISYMDSRIFQFF